MTKPNAINICVIPQLDNARQELDRRQANNQWLTILKNELSHYWHDVDEPTQQLLNNY